MSEEGHLCDSCHQLDGVDCEYCGVVLCEVCAVGEGHNLGSFECHRCHKVVCESYHWPAQSSICWFCSMNKLLGELPPDMAEKFLVVADRALDTHGDNHAFSQVLEHGVINIMVDYIANMPEKEKEKK